MIVLCLGLSCSSAYVSRGSVQFGLQDMFLSPNGVGLIMALGKRDCLSTCLSTCLFICSSVCLFVCLFVHLFVRLFICLFFHLFSC